MAKLKVSTRRQDDKIVRNRIGLVFYFCYMTWPRKNKKIKNKTFSLLYLD
jgi:hypothetical protein